ERGVVRSRFRLPALRGRPIAIFLGLPVLVAVLFVLVYLGAVFIGGDLLGLPSFGTVATAAAAISEGAAKLVGAEAVAAAGPPPPASVLLLAGIWGAAVAGWTINGLFAMGEEYGWRGLMWEALQHRGIVQANLVIGSVWGLWHAPVILQGYNYPDQPLLGVLAMMVFCTGMSLALTAVRRLTDSLLPVAAAHGTFNALAPILLILAPGTDRVLTGPVGLAGALVLAAIGAGLWLMVRRRPASTPGAARPTVHRR
ncbi:MAG TPA: CPBP family intramembrane glutamic endopeptidase, partial [Propionibacteriaceae bacterium]|nr:CPBP family intramembrane glutamic endopeptidase [Propionibacteriaceae bacterium]